MNLIKKSLIILSLVFATGITSSCSIYNETSSEKVSYVEDKSHLFGMCNLTYDMDSDQVDQSVTNEWSAKKMGALGVKSTRIWLFIFRLIKKNSNDNGVTLVKDKCPAIHDYIAKLKNNGVDRIVGMVNGFITPYEFNAPNSTTALYVDDDYEMYVKFLNRMEASFKLIAEEFPEIEYWEIENEPDIPGGSWFHRRDNSAFAPSEAAYITADLNWYASRAIKSVNPNNKILLAGITDGVDSPNFLDEVYNAIESGYLPTGQEFSDKNADNYFDKLAWHPYPTANGDIQEFINKENAMYDVVKDHGDDGKSVFLTEFGFSDYRFGGIDAENGKGTTQTTIANKMFACLEAIEQHMPWVECIFVFRLTNLYEKYTSGSSENSFGVFYSPDDPDLLEDGTVKAGYPKPIAFKLFEYFNKSTNYPESLFLN